MSDVTIDIAGNSMEVHQQNVERGRLHLSTLADTLTGGRLKRISIT